MSFLSSLGTSLLGGVLGSAVSGGINSAFAAQNAKLQAELQRENWKYMQSNAHQFEVQDLRAAGLNPILSATKGQAIGAPSIGMPSADTSNDINSAVSAKEQLKVAKDQIENERDKNAIELQGKANERDKIQLERDIFEYNKMNEDRKFGLNSAESAARVDQIRQNIINSVKLTGAQVDQLRSGTALNYKQLQVYAQNILESISRIGLNEKQEEFIEADLKSAIRKMSNMSAEEQIKFLEDDQLGIGALIAQLGAGARIGLPISGIGVSSSGNSGLRF